MLRLYVPARSQDDLVANVSSLPLFYRKFQVEDMRWIGRLILDGKVVRVRLRGQVINDWQPIARGDAVAR